MKVSSKAQSSTRKVILPTGDAPEDDTSPSQSESQSESESEGDEDEDEDEISEDTTQIDTTQTSTLAEKPRKRKRGLDEDDLEDAYFKRLQREEDKENKQNDETADTTSDDDEDGDESLSASDDNDEDVDIAAPPRHEIFDKKLKADPNKLTRTVFLGNVSTSAIKTSGARRTLTRHLRSVLKTPAHGPRLGKFESIRFRSTAYHSKSGPKRATFAKKDLMDATTTSTNAYAVFTTAAAAEHVAKKLNGTVVLDRHLRVDFLAKPLPVDHRRCIFIGNLSFVNEETQPLPKDGEEAQPPRRPTAKQPADAEEGLWRTFTKCGPVESVRVVRDQETRVSKGFAYVQFKDENSVEAALLLNDKKFPPMLPRKLRVMRARKTKGGKSTASAPGTFSSRTRAASGAGSSKSSQLRKGTGKRLIFEGHRATEGTKKSKAEKSKDGSSRRNRKRPTSSSARRGTNFKHGKVKKRDSAQSK